MSNTIISLILDIENTKYELEKQNKQEIDLLNERYNLIKNEMKGQFKSGIDFEDYKEILFFYLDICKNFYLKSYDACILEIGWNTFNSINETYKFNPKDVIDFVSVLKLKNPIKNELLKLKIYVYYEVTKDTVSMIITNKNCTYSSKTNNKNIYNPIKDISIKFQSD